MTDKTNHLIPVLIFAGITLTVGLIGILYLLMEDKASKSEIRAESHAPRRIDVPPLHAVPDFRFAKSRGGEISKESLRGKIWVVDFMFTTCPTICPTMTKSLAEVVRDTQDLPEVRFVSITVDPETDTLAVLNAYAEKFAHDPARWFFVRAEADLVHDFSYRGLGIGDPDNPIVGHSARFALIDADGRVRGFYHGIKRDKIPDVDELKEDLRELSARGGR
ncbi:MAG: SCO family protein [Planctomycetota bacterium]